MQQRRRRVAARLRQPWAGPGERWGAIRAARRHIPPALFLAGLAILLIALARPQTVVSLPRIEGTVILAFDVSGSMAADDLEPTRMEAAKVAAREFVERQPRSVQIGVVAFSDSGFAVQAPTNDQDAILAAIDRLTPQRGTSLGQGILASLNTIDADRGQAPRLYSNLTPTAATTPTPVPQGTYTSAVIVLLTDGENNAAPDPLAAAQAAADRGVRIYTVGIGSAAGATLTRRWLHGSHAARRGDAATDRAAHRGHLLQRRRPARPARDLRESGPAAGDEAGADGSHRAVCRRGILVLLIGGMCSLLWFSRVP